MIIILVSIVGFVSKHDKRRQQKAEEHQKQLKFHVAVGSRFSKYQVPFCPGLDSK